MQRPEVEVLYQPILNVSRGVAAGYQAVPTARDAPSHGLRMHPSVRRPAVAATVSTALAAARMLPTNTFISIPVPLWLVDDPVIHEIFCEHGDLSGVVLDITDFDTSIADRTASALDTHRRAGMHIAVGGREDAQPELGSITRLRPAIIRLGAAWTAGLDQHPNRRTAIELTGRLAGQLDAWILADDVRTPAELRALAELGVPLARGPFVGETGPEWPAIAESVRTVLPPVSATAEGVLRKLLQQAYTTRHLAAAQTVLPDASGFEYVVVVDEDSRPVSLLQQGIIGRWDPIEVLTVHVDTSVSDTVTRALARPRATRFSPIACTDAAGRFVGILRIERLMEHLAATQA